MTTMNASEQKEQPSTPPVAFQPPVETEGTIENQVMKASVTTPMLRSSLTNAMSQLFVVVWHTPGLSEIERGAMWHDLVNLEGILAGHIAKAFAAAAPK